MKPIQFNAKNGSEYSADFFPCGALITDSLNIIVFANAYLTNELRFLKSELVGKNIDEILTKSSRIFFQTYMLPILLHEKKCEEMQLIMLNAQGERLAVTVNAQRDEKGSIYWSFFNATLRDKLYDELINTREKLEAQTERLQSLASTDELTTLLNRREMDNRSVILLEQAKRANRLVALLVIDIDDFKQINDTHGHLEGDKVLKELGHCLKKICRQTDLVARYGGEEFLIMLPDTNAADALKFCQRLHKLIAMIKVSNGGLTVSIGACISDNKSSFTELFSHADTALYQAKANGKNTTYMHP